MGTALLLIVASFVLAQSSPISHKLKYNQSQEGVWNIRADLENFLIFVIPTSRGSGAHHNASLMDFLSKTIPMSRHRNRHQNKGAEDPNKSVETEQFIESKTAPYHVDISQARRHLAKLHPELNVKDDVIESGSVSLSKLEDRAIRSARAFIVKVPVENQNVIAYNPKETKEEFKKGSGDKPHLDIKFEDLSPELKTTYANILADVIKTGLKEYFRKVSVDLDESLPEDEDDDVPLKVRKDEKKKMVEKSKKKKEGALHTELQPPKPESAEKSETPKKTLI